MANETGTVKAKENISPLKDSSSLLSRGIYPAPVKADDKEAANRATEKVARRAYEIYQQNGSGHGNDLLHWLQAESEIFNRIVEVQQSDSTFSIVTPVPGFTPEEISVAVERNRALIVANKINQKPARSAEASELEDSSESTFFLVEWPGPVEPATANAQMKQGNLVLTVKRSVEERLDGQAAPRR
jgi:HSP20 family molecular chaperone IbpA